VTGSASNGADSTRGLNEVAAAEPEREPLGATGGSAGGGTRAGAGEPSGGLTDVRSDDRVERNGLTGAGANTDEQIAREATALGSVSGTLADAASGETDAADSSGGPVGGEAVGAGPGRGAVGSGLPQDHGELGGGGPPGQQGGSGPTGSDGGNT
jgi:hypothetical protein